MKSLFQKTIILILCAVIICALFGCNKTSGGESSSTTSTDKSATQSVAQSTTQSATQSGNQSATQSAPQSSDDTPSYDVLLYKNEDCFEINGYNKKGVKRGDSVTFDLSMKDNYMVESVSARTGDVESEIVNKIDETTTIIIYNVRFPLSLTVNCVKAAAYIAYYPNGGEYLDGSDAEKPYTVGHELVHRLRPNTEIGTDRIVRKGYVQTGWNTEPDGSGEHIGLGSRATVAMRSTLNLYAEWKKESPVEDFTFKSYRDGYLVSSYVGSAEEVVVPSTYNEKSVYSVTVDAFKGVKCIKTVVLPSTIESVAKDAFLNSSLEEIYFYDNLEYIYDNSFTGCENLSTVHVNAIWAPRYGKNLYSEYNLADKYDILILHQDEDKVIFFGGSGAYMSINCYQAEEALAGAGINKVCIDMAVNGWFNGPAQIEMINAYLKEGDVFVHAPETSSRYNVCYSTTMTPEYGTFTYNKLRFYYCLEANYDLISLFDVRHVTNFFNGFGSFNSERKSKKPTSYTEYRTGAKWYGVTYDNDLGYIDDRGSCALGRPHTTSGAGEADIVLEYISQGEGKNILNNYYHDMEARGIKPFFMTAPINLDTLEERRKDPSSFDGKTNSGNYLYYGRPDDIPQPNYSSMAEWVFAYERTVSDNLEVEVLLPLSKTLYHLGDYFEPDYHLADDSSVLYTADIANALIGALR